MSPSSADLLLAVVLLTPGLVAATGSLELPIAKHIVVNGRTIPSKGVYRRQSVEETVFDVQPWSSGGAYYTNVTVGTPPQLLTVILDTGSSDLYVDASSSATCEDTTSADTCRGGSFNPSDSSTYKVVDKGGFSTEFGDGSTAQGDYSTDTVAIGDVSISNVQLGVATTVNSTTGFAVSLLGLGYSAIEAATTQYPNMPDVLQQVGAIHSRLFSVFLDQYEATGTILFGAIDTSKYTGELHTFDILPYPISEAGNGDTAQEIIWYTLAVTGVSGSAGGKTTSIVAFGGDATGQDTETSLPVLLDTGSAAWTVPQSVYNKIADLFGKALNSEDGTIDCSYQSDDISLTLEFADKINITVPVVDFVVPLYDAANNQQYDEDGKPLCLLMVTPDTDGEEMEEQGFLTLGDSILRSMYVVFDLDNAQISVAQAVTAADSSSSDIKVVSAGAGGVASAVGSANGGVATAAANTYPIPPQITATQSLSLSTVNTAVGTETGSLAIPEDGRVTGTAPAESGTGTAASTSSTSKSAAGVTKIPDVRGHVAVVAIWFAMACVGAAIIL